MQRYAASNASPFVAYGLSGTTEFPLVWGLAEVGRWLVRVGQAGLPVASRFLILCRLPCCCPFFFATIPFMPTSVRCSRLGFRARLGER